MQHLKEKWLKLLNLYYFIICMPIVGGYIYLAIQQQALLIDTNAKLGINIVSASMAIICILHIVFISHIIKKFSLWLSYVLPFVLFGITMSTCLDISSGQPIFYFYQANIILFSLASVAYGYIVALAVMSIAVLFFTMSLSSTIKPTSLGIAGDAIVLVVRILISSILIILLRNKYEFDQTVDNENYIEKYFVKNDVIKLLTDSISDGIIITDKLGIIKSINPGAAKLLQQDIKDLDNLDYRSVLKFQNSQRTNIPSQENPVTLALNTQQSRSQELVLVLNNKKELFVDVVASAIQNKSTNEIYGCVVILRDVSKKRQEEEARSEFISTASHEMRTPVAAIEGYLALALNENVAKIDDKARDFLQKAHLSTEHLGRLFQDLLVSAKAEDGRLVSHPDVIEMGSFLEQITDDLKLITAKKGLGLEYITGSEEHASASDKNRAIRPLYYAYADPDRLREIITNLFDNAVKYTEKGKITVGLTGNNEVVQFFVRDTGSGIPPDDLPHLFQKFYRVDNSTTRTKGGTGLGLFISRKILELYNGRIWVESELGNGSTFYVNLPRIDSAKAAVLKNQPSSPTAISINPANAQ